MINQKKNHKKKIIFYHKKKKKKKISLKILNINFTFMNEMCYSLC